MSRGGPSYPDLVDTLAAELTVVADGFERLSTEQWRTPTALRTVVPGRQPWTLLELAGHLDISIGITADLIADAVAGRPEPDRDAVDFFVFPSTEVSADFYEYAYTMVDGHGPDGTSGVLRTTFAQTMEQARSTDPSTVGAFRASSRTRSSVWTTSSPAGSSRP